MWQKKGVTTFLFVLIPTLLGWGWEAIVNGAVAIIHVHVRRTVRGNGIGPQRKFNISRHSYGRSNGRPDRSKSLEQTCNLPFCFRLGRGVW